METARVFIPSWSQRALSWKKLKNGNQINAMKSNCLVFWVTDTKLLQSVCKPTVSVRSTENRYDCAI